MIHYDLRTRDNRVYRLSEREDGGWRVEQPYTVGPVVVCPGLQQALAEVGRMVPWDSWSRRSRCTITALNNGKPL